MNITAEHFTSYYFNLFADVLLFQTLALWDMQ